MMKNIARHRIPLPVTWLERAGKVDKTSGIAEEVSYKKLGGGNSIFFHFHPEPLGKISNLTSIFFKGVETTN